MNAWALKRKRIILLIVVVALAIIVGVPSYFIFRSSPTCFDTKQDGDEAGVDCGGSCTTLCTSESLPMIAKGDARVLKIGNQYEVVAAVENPNTTAQVMRANYTFTIYAAGSSTPLRVIKDATFIPRGSSFAIFAGPFDVSGDAPARAVFAWDAATLDWQKTSAVLPDVSFANTNLASGAASSRLDATVVNNSLAPVFDLELVALLSDASGNIFAASKTLVESLPGNAAAPIVFTWPFAVASSTSVQILPRALPDPSYIR